MFIKNKLQGARNPKFFTIGKTTDEECRVQGLEVSGVAKNQTTDGLLQADIGVVV
jgi:hypothetical protein